MPKCLYRARNNLRNAAQVKHFICFQGLLVALFLNCSLSSAPVILLQAALQGPKYSDFCLVWNALIYDKE